MGASLVVALDTRAPRLTCGAPTGANPGGRLELPYALDEPGLVSAELELADSHRLAVAVSEDRVSVALPADAPVGTATLWATVRDDVGNETTTSTSVAIGPVVVLTLDTRAPRVTWGPAGGTTAGELLEVLYDVDELGVVDAQLRLADGRQLAMLVEPGRMSVLLPADTPAGWATVSAQLVDDVGNQDTAATSVLLRGAVVPPVPRPAPGWPAPAPQLAPTRTVTTSGRLLVVGRTAVDRSPAATTSMLLVRSNTRRRVAPTLAPRWRLVSEATVELVSSSTVAAADGRRRALSMSSATRIRRREGTEEEALLLGLL